MSETKPASETLDPLEAYEIAVEAYIYFYPLVLMDITRRTFTNVEVGKMIGRGPKNTFIHARSFPPADFKGVVRPNLTPCIPWCGST